MDVAAGYTGPLAMLINGTGFPDTLVGATLPAGVLDPLMQIVGCQNLPAGTALSVKWFVSGSAVASAGANFWLMKVG
jgi:hypothetical protein